MLAASTACLFTLHGSRAREDTWLYKPFSCIFTLEERSKKQSERKWVPEFIFVHMYDNWRAVFAVCLVNMWTCGLSCGFISHNWFCCIREIHLSITQQPPPLLGLLCCLIFFTSVESWVSLAHTHKDLLSRSIFSPLRDLHLFVFICTLHTSVTTFRL